MNNLKQLQKIFVFLCLLPWSLAFAIEGNPEAGKEVFNQCVACHMLGSEAKHQIGPALNNIIDRPIASKKGFDYSEAFMQAAAQGQQWDRKTLDTFITNPSGTIPNTKMFFNGITDPKARANLIAFLAIPTDSLAVTTHASKAIVADEILALQGDAEYGEYLSSECTTCHQLSSVSNGIPTIIGWDTSNFVIAMHAYKAKHRNNPVMQLVAGRLSNEEIAALAEYFKNIK